jgi:hypothetical protein
MDRTPQKSDFQPYTDSDGCDHLGYSPRERLAAELVRLGSMRFKTGQRLRVSGTAYDILATDLARHRYWRSRGLTFDQAADAGFFERNGRGPWQGFRLTEVGLREAASDLVSSCRRAAITPLDCLVRYSIEVRS